jgi:hypothetical protein
MSKNTQDLNDDGVVDFKDQAIADANKNRNKGGGEEQQNPEDFPVIFRKGASAPDMVGGGTRDVRKTKTEAISAYATGQLNPSQKRILDSAYAKYKAAGGRAGKKGWWTDYVNAAADSGESPFDIVTGQYGSATDGSGANKYTSGSGRASTSVAISMYTPELANQILDSAISTTFGDSVKLTDKQRKDFYAKLTAGQQQGTVTKYSTKGGKNIATVVKSFDEEKFRKDYIGTVLEGMIAGKEELDLGGDAGAIQDTLRKYSDDMGVIRSDRDILSDVRRVVKGEITADDAANEVRKQSAVLYKNFADRLNSDPTLTVRDLANPYIKLMADTFETDMSNISLTDSTIQGVLSQDKLPAQGEFYKQLRQDARFRNTTTAQREAASFASGLASAMGF